MPGSLDLPSEHPLVFGTGACDPPGNDFPAFRNELLQVFAVFVINYHIIVHTEPADFTALVKSVFGSTSLGLVSIHNQYPFVLNLFLVVCDGFTGRFQVG